MKKIQKLFKGFIVSVFTSFSIIGCSMSSHKIEVNVINDNNESTIFDKGYRGEVVSETINHLVYTKNDSSKKAWVEVEQNRALLEEKNKYLADEFYADFITKQQDTYVKKFEILNQFIDKKMKFNNKEVKVIDGIKQEVTPEKQSLQQKINFIIYFQGKTKVYKFVGYANWNYKIILLELNKKVDEKQEKENNFTFFWFYELSKSNFTISDFTV